MSTLTDVIWDSITENGELHSELTKIMRKGYEPFLTYEQATTVHTLKLESYLREELAQWYEWLPERPIDMPGGEWAREALRQVDGQHGASLLLAELQGAGERRGSRHDPGGCTKESDSSFSKRGFSSCVCSPLPSPGQQCASWQGEHRCREGVSARRAREEARVPLTAYIRAGTLVQVSREGAAT